MSARGSFGGPRPPRRARAWLAGASALVGLALGWALLRPGRPPEPATGPPAATGAEQLALQDRLFAERAAAPTDGDEPLGLLPDSTLARVVIPERDARRLYPGFDRYTLWDRSTVFAHAPGVRRPVRWAEHPEGGFLVATDLLGMREDAPPARARPPLRVLVLGDSHTDGVCANDESFANRLEALLIERTGVDALEVLNGGKGGWCAYNHLGAVEKWRGLEPHLVVVTLYGGNDLVEATLYRHYFERSERPAERRAMAVRVVDASDAHPAACSQALAQTAYLTWTGDVDRAVDTTARVLDELDRTCLRIGAELLVAFLPAPTQVEPERHRARLDPALAALELEPADLAVLDRARDRLLERLAELGLATVDLTPALRAAAAARRLYWERDLHLAPDGHAAVAEALLGPVLASRAAATLGR